MQVPCHKKKQKTARKGERFVLDNRDLMVRHSDWGMKQISFSTSFPKPNSLRRLFPGMLFSEQTP